MNPAIASKRYAKLFGKSFGQGRAFSQGKISDIVQLPGGRADAVIQAIGATVGRYPYLAGGAGAVGTLGANYLVGNPIGGAIDALTFGLTNFKPDQYQQPSAAPLSAPPQGGMNVGNAPPAPQEFILNDEQRYRQRDYLKRKIATDILTLQALQQGG